MEKEVRMSGRNGKGPWNGLLFLFTLGLNTSSTSSFCPAHCHCDDIALSVNCQSASNLRVVPIFLNPQIKFLSLAHNQIQDITLSLQFYADLQFLDISLNQINSLGTKNFELMKGLKVLNVSYNRVKSLENGVFIGLGGLEVVDLTGNQIDKVEGEIFWKLRQVKEIILDRNRLEFIDWDLFRGLDTLYRISVQFNFIQVIEPSGSIGPVSVSNKFTPPWTLKGLRVLDLSSNQLTRVKDYSLVVFPSIKELNLCCNYIHSLEEHAFASASQLHLERVNLSQNRLGKIPTDSLVSLGSSIRQLDLSSNRISDQIPKSAFRSLFKLESLRLTDNSDILSIHPDALSDQINLIDFEADYLFNVTELSANLLENKPSLEHFSVKYASISTLPLEFFPTDERKSKHTKTYGLIRALDLTGNPIQCNCSVLQVYQYFQEQQENEESLETTYSFNSNLSQGQAQYIGSNHPSNKSNKVLKPLPFSYLSSLRCHSPESLSGILVKDLKTSDFLDCFTQEDNFQFIVIIIGATILSLILLTVGIKICFSCKGWKKVSTFCKNHQCCHPQKNSEEQDKVDQWKFESVMGIQRDLPPLPLSPLTATFHLNNIPNEMNPYNSKLHGLGNEQMKPFLETYSLNSPSRSQNYYFRESVGVDDDDDDNYSNNRTRPRRGLTSMDYQRKEYSSSSSEQLEHNNIPLNRFNALNGKYQEDPYHYLEYPPPLSLNRQTGNPVMLNYDFSSYSNPLRSPAGAVEYRSSKRNKTHRVKQMPNVLV